MANLHIMPVEKFTKNFIERMEKLFPKYCNEYIALYRKGTDIPKDYPENVKFMLAGNKSYGYILKRAQKNKSLFLHNISYLNNKLLLTFAILSKIKKVYWIMWGQDLYCYRTAKSKLNEFCRRRLIRNLRGIIFHVKGDYDLAKKWYNTKAMYFRGGYSSDFSVFEKFNPKLNHREDVSEVCRIQVGNSASPLNRHIDAFEKLKKLDLNNVEIYVPLSYAGRKEYIESVIEKGKAFWGDKFFPIIDFMSGEEYSQYLNSIDISIFNMDRQMALGNITQLALMGKKVYINDYTTSWDFYNEHGVKLFAFNKIDFDNRDIIRNDFLKPLSFEEKIQNFEMTKKRHKQFYHNWKKIFDDAR